LGWAKQKQKVKERKTIEVLKLKRIVNVVKAF